MNISISISAIWIYNTVYTVSTNCYMCKHQGTILPTTVSLWSQGDPDLLRDELQTMLGTEQLPTSVILRIFQHTPGTYPRPESPTVYHWDFLNHLGVNMMDFLGYAKQGYVVSSSRLWFFSRRRICRGCYSRWKVEGCDLSTCRWGTFLLDFSPKKPICKFGRNTSWSWIWLYKVIFYGFDPMVNHHKRASFGEYVLSFSTSKQANLSEGILRLPTIWRPNCKLYSWAGLRYSGSVSNWDITCHGKFLDDFIFRWWFCWLVVVPRWQQVSLHDLMQKQWNKWYSLGLGLGVWLFFVSLDVKDSEGDDCLMDNENVEERFVWKDYPSTIHQ